MCVCVCECVSVCLCVTACGIYTSWGSNLSSVVYRLSKFLHTKLVLYIRDHRKSH